MTDNMIMLQKVELIFILKPLQDNVKAQSSNQYFNDASVVLFLLTKILIIFSPVYLP